VKEEVNKLFGVKEKLQVLIDMDADVDVDVDADDEGGHGGENVTDVEMKDSFVLHEKACGSLTWDLNLVVSGSNTVYKWEEPVEARGQDHYKVLGGGSAYSPTMNLWPREDELYRRVGVLPALTPAAGNAYHRVGVYTVSFALRFSVVDLTAPTSTHTPAPVPIAPMLENKCFIGLAEVGLDDALFVNNYWKVDAFNGTLYERLTAILHDETDFLQPGHVLTLELDCSSGRLTFFRDGREHGTLHLQSDMTKLQFVAQIPIVGFEVVIVDDPVLVRRFL
jgi:hypothetical protein